MSLYHSPNIVRSGLIFHFDAANVKSYPGTGTSIYDLKGSLYTGTMINGPVFNTDALGNILLDGVNDYVNFGDVDIGTNVFSQSVWLKGNPTQTSTYCGIFCKSGNGNFGAYGLYGDAANSYVRFGFVGSAGQKEAANAAYTDLKKATWVNYTGTYDGANIKLYRNGILISSVPDTSTLIATNDPLSIGYRIASVNYYFHGNISCGMIYNRGLSQAEVLQNFNAQRKRFGL